MNMVAVLPQSALPSPGPTLMTPAHPISGCHCLQPGVPHMEPHGAGPRCAPRRAKPGEARWSTPRCADGASPPSLRADVGLDVLLAGLVHKDIHDEARYADWPCPLGEAPIPARRIVPEVLPHDLLLVG